MSKVNSETLSCLGGSPCVTENGNHFTWPEITEKTTEAVLSQLQKSISIYNRSGMIEQLEDRLADYFGVKYALLTNSGTQALHSMFVGADFKPGDEVLVPAYTFFATVTPIFFTGAKPVLVDCDENGNMDPALIEKYITKNTKGIVLTHMWGLPCDMSSILEMANQYRISVYEDVSHAAGATYNGRKVGSLGDAAALSLQGAKTLTGGEGGVLLTDHEDIYYRALLLGHYNKRCKQEIPKDHPLSKYSVTGMGMKYRIHPLAAAIVDEQLNNLPDVLEGRNKIALYIREELKDLKGIEVVYPNINKTSSWYSLMIKYKKEELENLEIDKFYHALLEEGCQELDRPGSTCALNLHELFQSPGQLFPQYKGQLSYKVGDFPNAEYWSNSVMKLPVWHDEKYLVLVDQYIEAFRKVIANYRDLL